MSDKKIIHSKSISNGCVVIIEEVISSKDFWSSQAIEKYRVYIKDYTAPDGYIYSYKITNNLLEAHLFFNDLCK